MNLEESLNKYKDITVIIIKAVKEEAIENIDDMFKQRQLILDEINKTSYSKEELKDLYIKYDIEKLEQTLELEIKSKKEELQKKIKENKRRQEAINGYNNLSTRAVFLSKEL